MLKTHIETVHENWKNHFIVLSERNIFGLLFLAHCIKGVLLKKGQTAKRLDLKGHLQKGQTFVDGLFAVWPLFRGATQGYIWICFHE